MSHAHPLKRVWLTILSWATPMKKIKTKTLPRKVITKSKQMMVIFLTSICVMPYRDGLKKGCAIHLWVKPRPYEKAKRKLFPGKSYFTKSKQITIIVLIKKDWLIYSSFYYYCLSCFLWYWFFAMLAVLTYLSIEHKKETLHFFFSFYKFALFFTIQSFVFLFNSQVIYIGEFINKKSKTQPDNWLHQANFPSKMPTTYQLFCFNQLP